MAAPATSAQARILVNMAEFGRLGVSEAPMTATDRGWKKPSRSRRRSAVGRPVTSTGGSSGTDGNLADADVRFVGRVRRLHQPGEHRPGRPRPGATGGS